MLSNQCYLIFYEYAQKIKQVHRVYIEEAINQKIPQPNNWLKAAKTKQEAAALDNSPLKSISSLSPSRLRLNLVSLWGWGCRQPAAEHHAACVTPPSDPRRPVSPDGHFSVSACFPHRGMGAIPLTARWAPTANQHRNIKASRALACSPQCERS